MQYGFYYDQNRCFGCNACTVACKDWNQVNPGPVSWRDQRTFEHAAGGSVFQNLSMACNHCAEPACLSACHYGAIIKDEYGIVTVMRGVCQGLQACITACPFAAPHIADDNQEPVQSSRWVIRHPMQKCTGCWQRVRDGNKPVCVSACVARALDFDEIGKLKEKYPDAVALNKSDFPYAYKNPGTTQDTKPSFLIKRRKGMKLNTI